MEPSRHTAHDAPATVICAWCRAVLNDGSEPVSHGICPVCLDSQLDSLTLVPYVDHPDDDAGEMDVA